MLNDFAKKWVEALRSGKYAQTKRQLAYGESYCCLGVACELAIDSGIISSYESTDNGLPEEVQNALGLRFSIGVYGKNTSLAGINDKGATFNEIADIIESEPGGLFV